MRLGPAKLCLFGAASDERCPFRGGACIERENAFVELRCAHVEHFEQDGAFAADDDERIGPSEDADALVGREVLSGIEPETAAEGAKPPEPVVFRCRLTKKRRPERGVGGGAKTGERGFVFDEGGDVPKGLVGITGEDDGDFGRGRGRGGSSVGEGLGWLCGSWACAGREH